MTPRASKASDESRHNGQKNAVRTKTLAAPAHTARPGQKAKHVGKVGSSVAGSSCRGTRTRAAAAVTQQRQLRGGRKPIPQQHCESQQSGG